MTSRGPTSHKRTDRRQRTHRGGECTQRGYGKEGDILDRDLHRAEVITCHMDPGGPARVEILPFVGRARSYERVTRASLRRLRGVLCSRRGGSF